MLNDIFETVLLAAGSRRHQLKIIRSALIGTLAVLSLTTSLAARAGSTGERVVQQIVLIRHGIRAPTKSPQALSIYSTRPWVTWPVAPGQLTAHGAQLMRSLGSWYRQDLMDAGLALGGCDDEASLKVIADSTPRNRASAAAMSQGLRPHCPVAYHAFGSEQDDPLFRGQHGTEDRDSPDRAPTLPISTMVELQQLLLGCHDDACLRQFRAEGKHVLLGGNPAKALKRAGSLSENLMLEYAQGIPLAHVGWGQLDGDGVSRLITLHNASFAFAKRPLDAARGRGGNMLAYITATLTSAAGQKTRLSPLAPAGTRALILVGHDTDLASQAGLLELHWSNAEQPDDYPPGGALIYQLLESRGRYTVRLRIALPTLAALRAGEVTATHAMHVMTLRLPGCDNHTRCPLATFQALAKQSVNGAIVPASGNEPATH